MRSSRTDAAETLHPVIVWLLTFEQVAIDDGHDDSEDKFAELDRSADDDAGARIRLARVSDRANVALALSTPGAYDRADDRSLTE